MGYDEGSRSPEGAIRISAADCTSSMSLPRTSLRRWIVCLACGAAGGCGGEQVAFDESVWQWPEEPAAEAPNVAASASERPSVAATPDAQPQQTDAPDDRADPSIANPEDDALASTHGGRSLKPATSATFASTAELDSLAEELSNSVAPDDEVVDPEIALDPAATNSPWQVPATSEAQRSAEAVALIRRAERSIRRGFELARRSAGYAARAQLLLGLQTIAEARDHGDAAVAHAAALQAALTAVAEARDFLPERRSVGAAPVARVVESHSSRVLSPDQQRQFSALQAAQAYYEHARDQFEIAVGGEPLASLALHGLGKMQPLLAHAGKSDAAAVDPEAAVYFAAAVAVDPNNFLAANELGVQYARLGRHEEAEQALREAAQRGRVASVWRNLAKVYEYRRNYPAARQAHLAAAELELAARSPNAPPGWSPAATWVRWTSPEEFATDGSAVAGAFPQPTPAATTAAEPPDSALERFSQLVPFRRLPKVR